MRDTIKWLSTVSDELEHAEHFGVVEERNCMRQALQELSDLRTALNAAEQRAEVAEDRLERALHEIFELYMEHKAVTSCPHSQEQRWKAVYRDGRNCPICLRAALDAAKQRAKEQTRFDGVGTMSKLLEALDRLRACAASDVVTSGHNREVVETYEILRSGLADAEQRAEVAEERLERARKLLAEAQDAQLISSSWRAYVMESDHNLYCQAGSDGECTWVACPQSRDDEPRTSGRSCPMPTRREE